MLARQLPLFFLPVFFAFLTGYSQETKIIHFKQEKLKSRLENFYVAAVRDDRPDTTTIGSVRAGVFSKKDVSLNLPGGAATAIEEFLKANLTEDVRTMPIVLHIAQLEVGEKTGGLKAESEVRMNIGFYSAGGKIMEYKGSNTVQGSIDVTRYIEELIRRGVDGMLQQFDSWAGQHQQQLKATLNGPTVQVEVEIAGDAADTDRIAWSHQRLLILDDFRGKPDDLSRAGAATNSGLDVKFNYQTQFGQTRVIVTILPFFDKTLSWCRTGNRNARTLKHEQQHFDITAIKACELATVLRNTPFTPGNYLKEMQQLVKQKEKEIQQQQDLYDTETRHGQVVDVQAQWEQRVQEMLGKLDCYK